ncbi:hypothetical protein M433DRAFT_155626 [Acidomyces richmondensis BFW]|nr:hypothetical protein M433DRAFT_155626 [Acidomyces richmondensis BFW]
MFLHQIHLHYRLLAHLSLKEIFKLAINYNQNHLFSVRISPKSLIHNRRLKARFIQIHKLR